MGNCGPPNIHVTVLLNRIGWSEVSSPTKSKVDLRGELWPETCLEPAAAISSTKTFWTTLTTEPSSRMVTFNKSCQRNLILVIVLTLGLALKEPGGEPCAIDSCCNATLGRHPLTFCRDSEGSISFPDISPPTIFNVPTVKPAVPRQLAQSNGTFTLRMLNLNVWGLKFESETVAVRMEAIKALIKARALYDFVLIQEAWYNEDYRWSIDFQHDLIRLNS